MYQGSGGAVRWFVGKAAIVAILREKYSLPSALSLHFHFCVPSREWWHRLKYWGQHLIFQQRKYEIKSAVKATFYVSVYREFIPAQKQGGIGVSFKGLCFIYLKSAAL